LAFFTLSFFHEKRDAIAGAQGRQRAAQNKAASSAAADEAAFWPSDLPV